MIQEEVWWLFLVLAPILYWLLPAFLRAWFLGIASLCLLALFAGADLIVMSVLAATVYFGPRLNPTRWPNWMIQAGRSTLPTWAVLIYFVAVKGAPALAKLFAGAASFSDVYVPLGVSYFSFKLLHYTIENRRGNLAPHRLGDFVSWLFLAPIFTAGPIERFDHYMYYREVQKFEFRFVREGTERIAVGIVKKFMLGMMVVEVMQRIGSTSIVEMAYRIGDFSVVQIWAILFLAFIYTYLDFSAYSDIAIGSSRLFGLRIIENFYFPFLAVSLPDFWLRWHISLTLWVRTYVYMSIVAFTRNPYFAVIVSFVLIGLWHVLSPHWAIWGLWHGCGLALYVAWYRFAKKRDIRFFHTTFGGLAARVLTMSFVALGGAFTALDGYAPIGTSLRLVSHAFGLRF